MPFDSLPERSDPVLATLVSARTLLEYEGWVRGAFHRGSGYCAIGALMQVVGVSKEHVDFMLVPYARLLAHEFSFLERVSISARRANLVDRVILYNDKFGREKTLRLFDRAIARRQALLNHSTR